MAAIYTVATVFFFPGLILTLGAGFAFGLLWGTVCVVVGSNAGACLAFLLGRFLLREWVVSLAKGYPVFAALDAAIAVLCISFFFFLATKFLDQSNGWLLIILIRLSPVIPFNVINYVLGITVRAAHIYLLRIQGSFILRLRALLIRCDASCHCIVCVRPFPVFIFG